MIHIGKKIEQVLKTKGISVSNFSKQINKSRTVVYDIFERESVDSLLLYKISKVLNFDFYNLYKIDDLNKNISTKKKVDEEQNKFDSEIKYIDLLEKYNLLLEGKFKDFLKTYKKS